MTPHQGPLFLWLQNVAHELGPGNEEAFTNRKHPIFLIHFWPRFVCRLDRRNRSRNIQDVRENYNIGQTVTVVGVVTSDDNLGSVRYLQDASAGIAIYPGQDWSSWDATPQIGDSLSVTGEITEYNGSLEVGSRPHGCRGILGEGTLPEPQVITPSQMGESLEGQLVRISGVTFPWQGRSLWATTPTTSTRLAESPVSFTFGRATRSSEGEELTGCEVDMIGIVSQFSFDGRRLPAVAPRPCGFDSTSDLCFTSPVTQTNMATTGFAFMDHRLGMQLVAWNTV